MGAAYGDTEEPGDDDEYDKLDCGEGATWEYDAYDGAGDGLPDERDVDGGSRSTW